MDAKAVRYQMENGNWPYEGKETILRALSLLASVEESSEEIVRELQRMALPDPHDEREVPHAGLCRRASSHILALRAEKEKAEENLIVVASQRDYAMKSNALNYERAEKAEAELASVKANCKIVYWPKDGNYPIEHTMAANKDCYEMILAQMERDRAAHTKDAP